MLQQWIMALGAGAASALLFVVPAKQSLLAMGLGVLAPLPLMIVALGLGERFGVVAAIVGAAGLGLATEPLSGGYFLLVVAAPSLILPFMARRPGLGEPGALVLTGAGLSTLLAWMGLGAVVVQYASLDAAIEDLANQLAPVATTMLTSADVETAGIDIHRFTTWVVLAMAPVAAAWTLAGLMGNLWLAGRVANISRMLTRAWPDIPTTLRMPRVAFALFGAALAVCAAPGLARVMGATAGAAMLSAFALQGLARLHFSTRGWQARVPLLSSFYVLCVVLFPWPLVLAAGFGLVDAAGGFRAAIPPPSTKNT